MKVKTKHGEIGTVLDQYGRICTVAIGSEIRHIHRDNLQVIK